MKMCKSMVLSIGLLVSSYFLISQSKLMKLPDCEEINCGKVVGAIIDSETKERVKEEFYIAFCDCNINGYNDLFIGKYILYLINSDSTGNFMANIPEGNYCLQFAPINLNSKYCGDPVPSLNLQYTQQIYVKGGQISNIQKIAQPGGNLRVTLVDINNNKINPIEIFTNSINIEAMLSSKKVYPAIGWRGSDEDDLGLNDGDILFSNLLPEKYILYVKFENVGYGNQRVENIEIERNKTTDIRIVLDKADRTGIEGIISDQNNNPIKDIEVTVNSLRNNEPPFFNNSGCVNTNANGYFKIVGLKEQSYSLHIFGLVNGNEVKKVFERIEIKGNIIIKRNIKVDAIY